MKRLFAAAVGVVAAVAMALLGALIALFAPVFLDDRQLDRAVAVVALDWRDFGRAKAEERLLLEMDKGAIGPWVGDENCTLSDDSGVRTVRCVWGTVITIPLLEHPVPLAFDSQATIGSDGRVH